VSAQSGLPFVSRRSRIGNRESSVQKFHISRGNERKFIQWTRYVGGLYGKLIGLPSRVNGRGHMASNTVSTLTICQCQKTSSTGHRPTGWD